MRSSFVLLARWAVLGSAAALAGCGGGASAPNRPPTAVATVASSALLGASVTLDGSRSADPEGRPLTYRWTVASRPPGSAAVPDAASSAVASLALDVSGSYVVELTVDDGEATGTATASVVAATVSVGVTAPVQDVLTGHAVQLTASVSGAVDPRVSWTASAGSVDAAGAFTAPGVAGEVVVTATSRADPARSASISIRVAELRVEVSPPSPAVLTGHALRFTASVTGWPETAVTWTASAGSIDAAGLFTAPAVPGPVQVTATSVADPARSASTTASVARLDVAVDPPSATVAAGGVVQFTASVSGWPDTSVSWTASSGTVDSAGLFRAPAVPGTCQVTVASRADPARVAVAPVTVTCNDGCPGVGATRCDGRDVQVCSADAYGCLSWGSRRTCQPSFACDPALGACRLAPEATSLSGRLEFEAREPNAARTDWTSTAVRRPARGFMVVSQHPDPANPSSTVVLDTTFTSVEGDAGAFSVRVRPAPDRSATDAVLFVALGVDEAGVTSVAAADPGASGLLLAPGTYPNARVWSWGAYVSSLQGGLLYVPVAGGSGAAHAFDAAQAVARSARSAFGRSGLSTVVWVASGTAWSCGACFTTAGTSVRGVAFQSQTFIDGDPLDQGFWSDAVTAHEMGHWAMASYGTSPREGGPHYMGVPTFPGQAWSEGWATFFSSDQRKDPVYLDRQDGTMFWFSLDARSYGLWPAWSRPVPSGGLLQMLDENDVAATLWDLSGKGAASAPLYAALASPRLNVSPFLRGYTRHTWTTASPGVFSNVVDTGVSAPALPDALDALTCAGFPRATLDAVVQPTVYYPYPSDAPLCR